MVATISPRSLADLRRQGGGVTLIDVRTPAEYGEVHVDHARNIPLDRLDPRAIAAEHGVNAAPIYFVCKSGGRSQKACEQMIAAGVQNVVSVEGGTAGCEAAGIEVVRSGRKVMSLDRQVRIAAGGLVVLGAALGYFLNPAWIGLSAFIGAGLVFAGLTDTCGMAMMLAKMPWNQARPAAGSCCARIALLTLVLGGASGIGQAAEHTKDSLDSVRQAVADQKAVLVDVREPEEWKEGHLSGARSLPLSSLQKGMKPEAIASVLPKNKIIYCHCLAGGRCLEAAAILEPLGYDVRPLKQGYPALVQAGFPAVVGQ